MPISPHLISSHPSDSHCSLILSMALCYSFYYRRWQFSNDFFIFFAPTPSLPPRLTPSSPLFMLQLLERYEKKLLSMTAESTVAQRQSASADARIGDCNRFLRIRLSFFLSSLLTYSFSPLFPTLPPPFPPSLPPSPHSIPFTALRPQPVAQYLRIVIMISF